MKPLTAAARAAYERATAQYERDYQDDEEAHKYLEEERGLSFATIGRMRLGVVRNPIDESHERFAGRICIPNISAADNAHITGVKFRLIEFSTGSDGEPEAEYEPAEHEQGAPRQKAWKPKKFDQPDGQVIRLYNLRALTYATDTIWVTAGEFDALSLEDVGLPAIAVPGTQQWGKSHSYRNRLLEGLQVVLMRDNDEAGLALVTAMSSGIDDLIVRDTSPCKDSNEYLMIYGPEALLKKARGQ